MSRFAIIPSLALQDKRLSPRDITVLCVIGTFTDRHGNCYPSMSTIGAMLGITRQAIQKSVKKLTASGYLTITNRHNQDGGQTSNMIHVNMDNVPPKTEINSDTTQSQLSPPATPEVAPSATPEVAPSATPEVAPSATSEVARRYPLKVPNERIKHIDPQAGREVAPSAVDDGFDEFWAAYPKRAGGNPKRAARKAWRARIRAGASSDNIIAGAKRYAAYCQKTDRVGTEFVKQAATFLGPDEHYLEDWAPPKPHERMPKTDEQWIRAGESVGVKARPGESMAEYTRRVADRLRSS